MTATARPRQKGSKIVEVLNEALASAGIEDTVSVAGEFSPRGHSGAGFAGGLIGGDLGDTFGSAVGGIGTAGGYLAGTRAHDAASGLPERMVVGVSETAIYGFAGNRAHPKALVFRVPREGLEAQVHQRVNVRVLELIETESGSRVKLEGVRLPITHSKDVTPRAHLAGAVLLCARRAMPSQEDSGYCSRSARGSDRQGPSLVISSRQPCRPGCSWWSTTAASGSRWA